MQVADLEPADFWRNFALICSIPHPSGSEQALAAKLMEMTQAHGLSCCQDALGNVRIDRPASPGWENAPLIILQGHLDMVPVANDKNFDFTTTPVKPLTDGEWVWAEGTTLGADDGSGLALALSVLFDDELQCGPLAGLFTVEEETGLLGSAGLSAEMLRGNVLFNMDLGEEGALCIGCAGGARQEFTFALQQMAVPPEKKAVKLTIEGMKGGHSGVCIHLKRGNAVKFLAQFAEMHRELQISTFNGGGADNAIPAGSEIVAAIDGTVDIEGLRRSAELFAAMVKTECDAPDMQLKIDECGRVETVWQPEFQERVLRSLTLAPDGVQEFNGELGIVHTSSNLAAIYLCGDKVMVRSSQRSMDDEARERISEVLKFHFASFGADSEESSVYPGWNPCKDGGLIAIADEVWEKLYGRKFTISAIHAGLECGWFVRKNPALQLLSFGATECNAHTPQEKLNVASAARYCTWLRQMICAVGREL